MRHENSYTATVFWRCGDASPTDFAANRYSRAHRWRFDGGAEVAASASPLHVPLPFSDPAGVDPEEAFVAALSSCHLLFFLYLAAKAGWVVEEYVDAAEGAMGVGDDGREAIVRVTLRPRVTFSGTAAPTPAEVAALHHAAHERCYLANSVRFPVVIEEPRER